jgi:phosphatidylglycerol:prolipoprotein diacylglycerol transferase
LVLAGVVGSRLFYLIQYRERVFANCQGIGDFIKATVNLTEGGLVLYGGLILGTLTYFVICRKRGIDPVKFGDAVVPAVFIGEACGRIGCLLNGCCYGDPCSLPWGIRFPHESVPWMALVQRGFLLETADTTFPLHPTQIYSSMNALVLAALTAAYHKHRAGDGSVLAVAIMGYALSRSCIEVLRGDELGQFGTVFTISQWVSMGVFFCGAALAWWSWRRSGGRLPSQASAVS